MQPLPEQPCRPPGLTQLVSVAEEDFTKGPTRVLHQHLPAVLVPQDMITAQHSSNQNQDDSGSVPGVTGDDGLALQTPWLLGPSGQDRPFSEAH